jgi:hypothetical protein
MDLGVEVECEPRWAFVAHANTVSQFIPVENHYSSEYELESLSM